MKTNIMKKLRFLIEPKLFYTQKFSQKNIFKHFLFLETLSHLERSLTK